MGRSLKQRLLAGGLWVLVGKVATAASTLVISALLAKLLDPDDVGVYFIADKLIWFASMLALLGLNNTVVRLVAESIGSDQPGRARTAVRKVYLQAAVGVSVAVAFLMFGGGAWLAIRVWDSPPLAGLISVVAVWAGLHSFQILTSEAFRGFQDLRLATIFGGTITGVITASVLTVVWWFDLGITLEQVFRVFVGAAGFSLVLGLFLLSRKVRPLGEPEPLPTREVLSISLPLWVTGILAYGLTQSDVLILGAFRPTDEVAIYGAAAKLVSLVLMSLMLVNLVVPPFIAELYARGERDKLERMLRLTATMAGIPAFAVLVAYIVAGGPILALVYRDEYSAGALILAILSVARLIRVWSGSGSFTLIMTGHQSVLMRITMVTSAITLVGCLIAVRQWAGIGVASVVAFGVSLQSVWVWLAARRRTGLWTHMAMPTRRDLAELIRRAT